MITMGKIKGWRKTFETSDYIAYQATENLLVDDPQALSVFPKDGVISMSMDYDNEIWITESDPARYFIDRQTFSSKKKALGTLIQWMKSSKITQREKKVIKKWPENVTIELSGEGYMEHAYFHGDEEASENFIREIFTNGWKGVQKEYPTLNDVEWGFITSGMCYEQGDFFRVANLLNLPILHYEEFNDDAIDLPEAVPGSDMTKQMKKIKIIWRF